MVSTAFGLGTWLSAAFLDSEVERLLNITTLDEQVLLFVGAGYSNGDDVDVESRHVLSQYLTINPDET
ncbi:hypothetical protein AWV80_38570 [Cupriavidus sp. UYMU48A]|nr:hypothetical protein AWV80_38570 [Cupriavidus sp. UYMU48A]